MATAPTPLTSSTTLPATGNKPQITVSGLSDFIQAIATDSAFPASTTDVTITQLTASTGSTFQLTGIGSTPVTFSASANAALAAYQTPAKLQADLGFQSDDGKLLNVTFPADPNGRFMVVRWGFDASVSASGKMALNPAVTLNFGASASGTGLFAFVLKVDKTRTERQAFLDLLGAWCTPGDIANNSSALLPGAWIVTEVTGQLAANLGVTAGYDLNWVKTLKLEGLDGDIGLRISLGLNATLSAQLGGKYYLVVNRETALSGVRVRLFRGTTKGWGFALNTGASVTPSTPIFPKGSLDDLIRGILGTSDPQLLSFLQASSLSDIGNALGTTFLKSLRLDQDENKAFADLTKMFNAWNNLPSTVTSAIWKNIPDLTQIQSVAKQISQVSDDSIRTLLDSLLEKADFPDNAVVQWLEAATSKSLFELYESTQLQELRNAATTLTSLLDGDTVQTTLTNLKSRVDNALSLSTLETALSNNNLSGVATWVVQQLAKFLGVDLSQVSAQISKINQAIQTIRNKADEIYAATWKAVNTTYGFELNYAYTLSDTQSALIDVTFADTARASLSAALKGDFSAVLAAPVAGVTLGTATLTHGIERHTHVETHLPWWTGVSDDLAKGFATSKLADGVDGRVVFYEAGATDTVTFVSGANLKRFASCSIGISAQAKQAGVRNYNVSSVDFGFSFAIAKASMTRSEFEYDFGAAADQYFPNAFGDESPDSNHAIFNSWVVDWDKFTDRPGMPPGDGVIGNTWTNLQVRIRAGSGADWVSALLNGTKKPDYLAMSRAMQTAIRRWLLVSYASDPLRFKNIPGKNGVSAFLVYTAMPAKNGFLLQDPETLKSDPSQIVWDVRDLDLAAAMTQTFAPRPLSVSLGNIFNLLLGIPALKSSAQFYRDSAGMINDVVGDLQVTDPYITLLQNEKAVIDGAQSAFEALRKSGQKLQSALPVLAAALTDLVSTFNNGLSSLSLDAPEVMESFAPMIFQQAVAAMFSSAAPLNTDALLDVAVLKPGVALPSDDQGPTSDQVLLRQRITNFS